MMRLAAATACLALAVGACSEEPEIELRSAAELGRTLFYGKGASESSTNRYACSTCHVTDEPAGSGIFPGAPLGGANARPTFWGGQATDMLAAVNHCRYYFMGAGEVWTRETEGARAMYAFLTSLPPTLTYAIPFTIPAAASDLPPGDAVRGEFVYNNACATCHGVAHTGIGRLDALVPIQPEESVGSFKKYGFDSLQIRMSFIEKVRHGGFLGLYGDMAPFSVEALPEKDLSAVLTFLGLYP